MRARGTTTIARANSEANKAPIAPTREQKQQHTWLLSAFVVFLAPFLFLLLLIAWCLEPLLQSLPLGSVWLCGCVAVWLCGCVVAKLMSQTEGMYSESTRARQQ